MKRTIVTVAVLALMSGAAFAAHHDGHDSSPPAGQRVVQTDKMVKHDMTTTNKMGTTKEGSMKHTQTTPAHGTRVISESSYKHHTPSAMARSHELKRELTLGMGGSYSFAKDSKGARLSDMGLSGGVQMMWHTSPHLAIGMDYAALTTQPRSNSRGGNYGDKHFHAHNLSLAGKLTLNPWSRMQVYVPMGVGMSQVSLKGAGTRDGVTSAESDHKWGLGMYAGLGMQYNLTDTLFMGLEYRYHLAFVKTDDLNRYGRDRYTDFHSAMLKVGMRF